MTGRTRPLSFTAALVGLRLRWAWPRRTWRARYGVKPGSQMSLNGVVEMHESPPTDVAVGS